MNDLSKQDSAGNGKPASGKMNVDAQFDRHLHEIHRLFVQFLNPRLKKFYDGLNDFFFDLAEAARNNVQQNQYFAAIGDTRKNNAELNRMFAKNINARMKPSRLFGRVALRWRFTQKDQIRFPLPQIQREILRGPY